MAITIDWGQKIIEIPRNDLLLIQSNPTEIRQLNLDEFRLNLKSLEDSSDGMAFERTHNHNTTITVGGVTLSRVIEIINGYTITFEDGQYAVNLVGANSNLADKTNVNQVSVRSANSAGLTFNETINNQSFTDASVYIDINNGSPGINFPRGTPTNPTNNLIDAYAIAAKQNIKRFHIRGEITLDQDYIGWSFNGIGVQTESIINTNGYNISGSNVTSITLTGNMITPTIPIEAYNSKIRSLNNFYGNLNQCSISGNILFAIGQSNLVNCYNDTIGNQNLILDCQDNNTNIIIRGFIGSYQLVNVSHPDSVISVDMLSGEITLNNSVDLSNGASVILRGISLLINNSITPDLIENNLIELFSLDGVSDEVWSHTGTHTGNEKGKLLIDAMRNAQLAMGLSA